MSVKHAVLGLLIEEPDYPYNLMLRMRGRLGFWQAGTSVNNAFDTLVRDGHIRKLPGSSWCEATPEGVKFFEAWMLESVGVDAPPLRSELLMKLGFPATSDELLVQMYRDGRAQEQWCVDRINELAHPGDLAALVERQKDAEQINPLLVREAEAIYLNATKDYLAIVLRELRRVFENRTGRRLEA